MTRYFQAYFSNRISKLVESLETFEKKSNESNLHEIRIHLKKSLTIISFFDFVKDNRPLQEIFHEFKIVFRIAGKIREGQLLKCWLTKKKMLSLEKIFHVNNEITKSIHEFHKELKRFKKSIHKLKSLIDSNEKRVTKYEIVKYFNFLEKKVNMLFYTLPPIEKWHSLRKKSKKLIFVFDWVQQNENFAPIINDIKKLQKEIGSWHDKIVIKETLTQKMDSSSLKKSTQKDFAIALIKLNRSIRYSEHKITLLLHLAVKTYDQRKSLKSHT